VNQWVDVPGTAITRIWESGQYKASYVGQLWLAGSNATMYMRVVVRYPDGSQADIANSITQRFQSVFPETSNDTQFFALQGNLFNLPLGEATIVAQVLSNHPTWTVSHMTLIVEY